MEVGKHPLFSHTRKETLVSEDKLCDRQTNFKYALLDHRSLAQLDPLYTSLIVNSLVMYSLARA